MTMEKTKDKLAAILRERGLHEMALRAAQGVYDDFESDLLNPIMALVEDCRKVGAHDLAARAINGESCPTFSTSGGAANV